MRKFSIPIYIERCLHMEAGWKSGVAQPSHGGVGAASRGRGGRGWRRPGAGCVGLPGLCVCSAFLRNVYRRITLGRSRCFMCDGVNGWFPGALCRTGCSFGRMSRTVSEGIRGGAAAAARAATSGGAGEVGAGSPDWLQFEALPSLRSRRWRQVRLRPGMPSPHRGMRMAG